MLKNIFITGTSSNLILQMGNMRNCIDERTSYYHTVTTKKPKSAHISSISSFTAQLLCTYARTNLSQIDTIIACFRVPSIPSFGSEDKEKLIEKSFQTEWCFSVDLLRQLLLLFTNVQEYSYLQSKHQIKHKSNRLYICIPLIHKSHLNDMQQIYYNSFVSAIKTFLKEINTSHEIALIFIRSDHGDENNVIEILNIIQELQNKKIGKKIVYQETLFQRLKRVRKIK